ncbi:MAG: polysaccharide pyruvyl transferase family protein [Anaerolineales bacterium]
MDHWEDYESVGDKAMLLNALRRLELHLGPCQFVGPLSPEKAGQFQYPGLTGVVPPHLEVTRQAGQLKGLYLTLIKFLPSRLTPKIKNTFFLDVAISSLALKLFLYSIGLRFVFGKLFRNFLDEISTCDVFFTVGDCSLSDLWLDGVVLKAWLVKLVRPFVSVSVLSSQGIGPLETAWARKRLVGSFQSLDILSFRDHSYSQALVEAEGLKGVPYQIVADEAFSFPVADQAEVWKALEAAGASEAEPFIIVNFRNTDFTQSTSFLLNKIASLLDSVIAATNKKMVFIPMSKGDHYGRDHAAGMSLKGMMKQAERLCVLEPLDEVNLVKGIIGAAAYSIGISYHLHVFSLSQGHPTLIVYTGDYYKTKSEGLISFYGPPNRAVNFSEVSVEQTLEYVLAMENNYAEACAQVRKVNRGILENNDWTIKMLKSELVEKGLLDR